MTTFSIVLLLAAATGLVWLVARLVVALRRDGYGTTPPPSSHADWSDSISDLPSHPFRSAR